MRNRMKTQPSVFCGSICGLIRTASPLTPALSPLRGEGVACGPLRHSIVAMRSPSPLRGERAGVRGEAFRINMVWLNVAALTRRRSN